MSDADDTTTDVETDWLANSIFGFGFGYTKKQALREMARHTHPNDADTVGVDLVEHVGGAEVGPGGWRVDQFVSGERVEIPTPEIERLRDAALEAEGRTLDALDAGDSEPIDLD